MGRRLRVQGWVCLPLLTQPCSVPCWATDRPKQWCAGEGGLIPKGSFRGLQSLQMESKWHNAPYCFIKEMYRLSLSWVHEMFPFEDPLISNQRCLADKIKKLCCFLLQADIKIHSALSLQTKCFSREYHCLCLLALVNKKKKYIKRC